MYLCVMFLIGLLKLQVDSYHQYLETCLKNLTVGKNQKRILQHRSEGNHLQLANALKSRTTLHYSATKLHQKGTRMYLFFFCSNHQVRWFERY